MSADTTAAGTTGDGTTGGSTAVGGGAGRGGGLFGSEVLTLFRRRRTQAILAVLAGVPILIAVAVKLTSGPGAGEGPPLLDRVTQNGLFVGVTALILSVPLFVPLAIGVVAGDTIAGEANLGTLRYLLLAPAGRTRLLVVKYATTAVFCCVATLTVVLTGAVVGGALFGLRPVPLLSGDEVSVPQSFLRALLVAAFVSVSMLGLSAIGLFVSTLTEIPVGAMAATVTLAVASQIVDGIPQLDVLDPYLFSHYWLDVGDLLRTPVAWGSFVDNATVQLAYIAVFGSLAWARLTTKDVLS